ncbi:uncharacterized protein LOC121838108 [Ixodes scapularis]|uniref:uncharacterized protein LOC121838108 n=1 Tax=Ixodes scapularis TaxID=6945 RepID=UPI001C380AE8|nr:uncharacterized protein LOC121838108 [Ixodes scapularis]
MESFENHSGTDYHKRATVDAQSFLDVMTGNVDSSQMQLNKQAKEEHKSNKAKLCAIVETVLLCGRQDLALRGDKDSGRLTLEESVKYDGKFSALLRYRANGGDCTLAEHIRTAGNNALYTSPTIKNEITSIIGNLIQDKIVEAVHKAGFFAVIADETSDVSQTEQFSLCVRYVEPSTMTIREEFLCFVAVEDVSASNLAHTLKHELLKLGLNLKLMRGQGIRWCRGYEWGIPRCASADSRRISTALYRHCSSHSFNFCLSDASAVQDIKRAFGTFSDIC